MRSSIPLNLFIEQGEDTTFRLRRVDLITLTEPARAGATSLICQPVEIAIPDDLVLTFGTIELTANSTATGSKIIQLSTPVPSTIPLTTVGIGAGLNLTGVDIEASIKATVDDATPLVSFNCAALPNQTSADTAGWFALSLGSVATQDSLPYNCSRSEVPSNIQSLRDTDGLGQRAYRWDCYMTINGVRERFIEGLVLVTPAVTKV